MVKCINIIIKRILRLYRFAVVQSTHILYNNILISNKMHKFSVHRKLLCIIYVYPIPIVFLTILLYIYAYYYHNIHSFIDYITYKL